MFSHSNKYVTGLLIINLTFYVFLCLDVKDGIISLC